MPTFLWSKSVTRAWLERNQNELDEFSLAVIERPGRHRLLIEVTTPDIETARRLTSAFDGKAQKLPRNYIAGFLRTKSSKPIRIGNRLVIANDGRARIGRLIIPAGVAFGTGEHATTAMSLRLLERMTRPLTSGWRMLDAGSGSGILALAGHRFGAREVIAIDNDLLAISTALSNARLNRIKGVKFICGDATKQIRGKFDVIAANLYSELLVAVLPRFQKSLAPQGWLILSGVMRNQERGLLRALKANAFAVTEIRRRGKWIALLAAYCSCRRVGGRERQRSCSVLPPTRRQLQQKRS